MTSAMVEATARGIAACLHSNSVAILRVGLPLVRQARSARLLAGQLVRIVASLRRLTQPGHVFVEGGATAVELVRRMGWSRFTVLHELAPGVATLRVADTPSLCVTMKPGSYIWPAQIRALACSTRR